MRTAGLYAGGRICSSERRQCCFAPEIRRYLPGRGATRAARIRRFQVDANRLPGRPGRYLSVYTALSACGPRHRRGRVRPGPANRKANGNDGGRGRAVDLSTGSERSTVAVAFQGALSPLIADTRRRAQAGEFGELVSVAATIAS
jgi:hypothetical protein